MTSTLHSPVGHSAIEAAKGHTERSQPYRDARAEYERIRALKEISPIAAHLRERRFELGLTQNKSQQPAPPIAQSLQLRRGPTSRDYQRSAHLRRPRRGASRVLQRTVAGEIEREFPAVDNHLADNTQSVCGSSVQRFDQVQCAAPGAVAAEHGDSREPAWEMISGSSPRACARVLGNPSSSCTAKRRRASPDRWHGRCRIPRGARQGQGRVVPR